VSALLLSGLMIGLGIVSSAQAQQFGLTPQEQLGKFLFYDQNLSLNNNQACAACHGPEVGYTGPDELFNSHGGVYEGSIAGNFGNRKPPAAAYAGDSPKLHYDAVAGWVGGMFWDGRATGHTMGDPLAEQAKGPFLNPKEQAIPDSQTLCKKVNASAYADLFVEVWGRLSCGNAKAVGVAYDDIAMSIAAYERSQEVSSFTSRFDGFWDKAKMKGMDVTQISMVNWEKYQSLGLNNDQLRGLAVFNTKAKCSSCHTLDKGTAGYPLFTDFTYDNLGIPKNPENPATIANPAWADPGLGGFLEASGHPKDVYSTEIGKFKVPTLRNVDLRPSAAFVKAYGHNGYFKSLEEIVHFYNTRNVQPWPAPEVSENMNTEIGNLGLNKIEEQWIVEFLKTLSNVQADIVTNSGARAAKWLASQQQADGGFTNGFSKVSNLSASADVVVTLAVAKAPVSSATTDYLAAKVAGGKLATGEYAKVALAVKAVGLDPYKFGGKDLIAQIQAGYDAQTGVIGDSVFVHSTALLALATAKASIPAKAITALEGFQSAEGGWAFSGKGAPDVDTTAQAVLALIAVGRPPQTGTAGRGLGYLHGLQNKDGGFPYQSPSYALLGSDSNTNSSGLVAQAIVASGDQPESWAQPMGNPLSVIILQQQPSGAFAYQGSSPGDNIMATIGAIQALYRYVPAGRR
jgi:cytochrome c peroxidase